MYQYHFKGSVINVQIKWMCNLDFSIDGCIPEVKFSDMDDLGNTFSPGYNFRFCNRFANFYRDENGTEYRDLIKAYGMLFVFNIEAEAGKFSIVQLTLNVGAGLALLGLGFLGDVVAK
uniref:Uncharacterized protein n=1 Tax=Romanomermis culicivorax TaxID=13658 RepID=A0A915LA25_ROMCU